MYSDEKQKICKKKKQGKEYEPSDYCGTNYIHIHTPHTSHTTVFNF